MNTAHDATPAPPALSPEERFETMLAEYLEAAESESPVSRTELLSKHPDFADELESFFGNRDRMERLAEPLSRSPRRLDGPMPQRDFGDYELLEEIAAGGMGVVYKARQKGLNRVVALKMIRAGTLAGEDDVRRFREEAETAASLKHPSIVTIHEVGRRQGQNFFSMDYVEGRSLAEIIADGPERATGYVKQIVKAVHYAHEQGILHRDLKPSNVLIEGEDRVHVTDFGLAKRIDSDSDLTLTGQILGTPGYMSPEQAGARHDEIGPTSDVYSLGVILYELLTGRPPFRGVTLLETLQQTQQNEPAAPCLLNPRIPRDLETICLKCLQKSPPARYGTANELAHDLSRFEAGEPILARPIGPVTRAVRWCWRHPAASTAWAAGVLAAVFLVVGIGASAVGVQFRGAYLTAERAKHDANAARRAEEVARIAAEMSRETERKLRHEKEGALGELARANRLVETSFEEAQNYLYFLRIAAADRAWHDSDIGRAEELLALCPAHLRDWEWTYLQALCHRDLATIDVDETVLAVAIDDDADALYCVNDSGEVARWDIAKRRSSHRFATIPPDSANPVRATSAAFDEQCRQVAVGTSDGNVVVHNLATGNRVASISKHRTSVRCLAFDCDGGRIASGDTASASWGAQVCVSDIGDGLIRTITIKEPACVWLQCLAFHPAGELLAVSGAGTDEEHRIEPDDASAIVLADLTSGEQSIISFRGGGVLALDFSADSGVLVAATHGGTLQGWNVDEIDRPNFVLRGHVGPVRNASFDRQNRVVYSCGDDRTIRRWDVESLQQATVIRGHREPVRCLAVSPDGLHLCSADSDSALKVWNSNDDPTARVPAIEKARDLSAVAFAQDDQTVAVVEGRRGAVYVEHAASGESLELRSSGGGVDVACHPQLNRIFLASRGRGLYAYDARNGELSLQTRFGTTSIRGSRMAVSPDGELLAVGVHEGVALCSPVDGSIVSELKHGLEGEVVDVAFSGDGRRLAAAVNRDWKSTAIGVVVWELPSQKRLLPLEGFTNAIISIDISFDGSLVAAGGGDVYEYRYSHLGNHVPPTELRVWDVASGQTRHTLEGHKHSVWAVAFSKDGRRLASGSGMWAARGKPELLLWEMRYGQPLLSLEGHQRAVTDLVFSRDGLRLASVDPLSARIWGPPRPPKESANTTAP